MLENLKQLVLDNTLNAENMGLCKYGTGNISIRDKETGYVVITPSHVIRKTMTIEDICVVDINGHIIEAKIGRKPSSEVLMHLECYKVRKDAMSIVHTHSFYATAFSILKKEIRPIVYEAVSYGGKIASAPYGRPGTKDLAIKTAAPLKYANVCLMQGHGVLVVGNENVADTLINAQYVEDVARLNYLTYTLNGNKDSEFYVSDEELCSWEYPCEVK